MMKALLIVGIIACVASFVVLEVGHAYCNFVFRPDYHGGWWEALTVGIFDFEGWIEFAKSTPGKLTYGGAGGLMLVSIGAFWLFFRLPSVKDEGAEEESAT